jgi:phage terminase small subunit
MIAMPANKSQLIAANTLCYTFPKSKHTGGWPLLTGNDRFSAENSQLSTRQETFILALLSSSSIIEAARIARIAERTGRRWLKLAHVQQAYQAAQQEVFDDAITTLKLAMHDAVTLLRATLKDSEIPASTRVRAAQIILEHSLELHKIADLEARISELEQMVRGRRAA